MKVLTLPQYPLDLMWNESREMARGTVGLNEIHTPVSEKFKREMLSSMHSPVRELRFKMWFQDIPTFTAQHYSRHRIATIYSNYFLEEQVNPVDVEHYVKTQRPDRTGEDRGMQSTPVSYRCTANVQGLQDMSQKRLCFLAEAPARGRWGLVKAQIHKIEPLIAKTMVPTCVFRGFCPEAKMCPQNYVHTKHFQQALSVHRSLL